MAWAPSDFAASSTCARMGRPASGCSTLGRSDFMRLPWPAARMTTERGCAEVLACVLMVEFYIGRGRRPFTPSQLHFGGSKQKCAPDGTHFESASRAEDSRIARFA